MKKTHTGTCHCGAIRFECDVDLTAGTTRCNCTFCGKARFWMAFVPDTDFRLLAGEDDLSDYRYSPPGKTAFLHLTFCRTCGIRPFSSGGPLPQFGGPFHAVNVACLDVTPEELAALPVAYADGANNDWPTTPPHTRHL